ncbi:MAG: 4'-phosphopantetheinyl transferase superfamily protein, partial [Mangrovicoccus sp.]|nr:4'-phosphopantetheinyl transferase superfamily protein [Mangrovicoccus sp.]
MSPLDTAVEIWLLDTRRASARALELCRQVASQPEHERAARYRQTRDGRNLYLGHGLARMATARHCQMDPRELQWCCDDRGKPSWGNAPFAFSLSHSGGFVALALAGPGAAIGVDIQEMSPRIDTNRIANYALSPEECTVLDHSEGTARQRRFFQLWVLREAGLKASGEGIFTAPKTASA